MWEYKTLTEYSSNIDTETNSYTSKGWEVFAAYYTGTLHTRLMRKWKPSGASPPPPPPPQVMEVRGIEI